jgi:hypothetical protein
MWDDKTGRRIFVSNKSMWANILPRTRAHKIPMPERSFMRTALNEMQPQIREVFENAVADVVTKLRSAA